jgi:hypothetical protein
MELGETMAMAVSWGSAASQPLDQRHVRVEL